MTTAIPIPDAPNPIALTVLDPISADVVAVANATTAICTLLTTPQGQKVLADEIALGHAIETAVSNVFAKIFNAIGSLLGKLKK